MSPSPNRACSEQNLFVGSTFRVWDSKSAKFLRVHEGFVLGVYQGQRGFNEGQCGSSGVGFGFGLVGGGSGSFSGWGWWVAGSGAGLGLGGGSGSGSGGWDVRVG